MYQQLKKKSQRHNIGKNIQGDFKFIKLCKVFVVKYRHMIGTKGVSYLYIGPLFNYVCSFVCVFYMCNYSIIFS